MSDLEFFPIISAAAGQEQFADDQGAQEHAGAKILGRISVKEFRQKLEGLVGGIGGSLANLKRVGDWEMDEISIGLAIDAKGSIGFVSGGATATLELKFVQSGGGAGVLGDP